MKRSFGLIVAVAIAGALAVAGEAPTAASSPRSGALHVTKECSAYTGLAGSFCTITSSNLNAIKPGSKVVYAQAAGATSVNSDFVLYAGHHSAAFGHVALDFVTATGQITITGGTGRLNGFHARVAVSLDPATGLWHWDGTYRFSRHDDDDGVDDS
jgi:hypothetical protein